MDGSVEAILRNTRFVTHVGVFTTLSGVNELIVGVNLIFAYLFLNVVRIYYEFFQHTFVLHEIDLDNDHTIYADRNPIIYLSPEDLQGHKTKGKTTQGKFLLKDKRAEKLEARQEANELRYRRSKQKKVMKEMISKEERAAQLSLLPKEDELLFPEGYNVELSQALRLLKIEDIDVLFGSMIKSEYRADTQQESDRLKDLERRIKALKNKDKTEFYLIEARDVIFNMFNHVQRDALPIGIDYEFPLGVVFIKHEDVKFPKFDTKLFYEVTTGTKKIKITPPLLIANQSPNWLFDFFSGYEEDNKGNIIEPKKPNFVKRYLFTLRDVHSIIVEMKKLKKPFDTIMDTIKGKMYLPRNKPFNKKMTWITSYLPAEVYYYEITDHAKFSKIFSEMIEALQSKVIEYAREHYKVSCMTETDRNSMYEHRAKLFADIMRQPSYQLMFQTGFSKEYIVQLIHKENHSKLDSQMTNSQAYISHMKMKGKVCHKVVSTRRDAKYEDLYADSECPEDEPQSFGIFIPAIQSCFVGMYTVAALYLMSTINSAKKKVEPIIQRVDYASHEIVGWLDFIKKPSMILSDVRYQPILIEIKSILHACYHFYKGNKTEGIAWLTNLLVTRPDSMLKIVGMLNSKTFENFLNPPQEHLVEFERNTYVLTRRQQRQYLRFTTDEQRSNFLVDMPVREAAHIFFEFQGHTYQLAFSRYQQYRDLEHDENRAFFLQGEIRLESQSVSDMAVSVISFFQEFGISYLTEADIRNANQKFQFVRNNRQSNEDHSKAIQNIISVVVTLLGGCDPFNKELMDHQGKMAAMNKYMDEVLLDTNKTPERTHMVLRLKMYKEATELIQAPQMEKVLTHMKHYFMVKVKSFESKAKEANKFLGRDLQRYEPTTVLFSGPPKTGKTAAMNFFGSSY
jgi:hypothetical protein